MTDDREQKTSTDPTAKTLTQVLDGTTPTDVCVDSSIDGGSSGGCDVKGDKELPPGERERPAAANRPS